MLQIFTKVALILFVLFVFGTAGFLLRKSGLVRTESLFSLANILLCFCQPLLSVKAFAIDPIAPSGRLFLHFFYVALISFVAILVTFGASALLFRFMKGEGERRKRDILVCASTFSNCSFIGLPFVEMFSDGNSEAMMYVIVFSVVFNAIIWTLGAYLITQDRKQISLKKAFLNPCAVGSLFGLLLFVLPQINFFNLPALSELQNIVVYAGNMTAPLSMLIAGVRLAELSPRQLFCDPKIYLASAMRLIGSAAVTYLLLLPFKLTGVFAQTPYVLLAPLIAMSMPPAASMIAFAEKYGGEKEYAAAVFSTANLLALPILPAVLLLLLL